MTILYSCISRGSIILCSHQNGGGDFATAAGTLLPQMARTAGKSTYNSDRYLFHTVVENGIVYLCCASTEFGREKPYAFLTEIHGRVSNSSLSFRLQSASANDLQRDFASVLASQMERYGSGASGSQEAATPTTNRDNSQLGRLQSQVDDVREVMSHNINKVLQRGERLEDLVDRSEDLEASSQTFRSTTRLVAKKFWWQNMRMKLICGLAILLVVIVLIVVIVFSTKALPDKSGTSAPPTY